MGLVFTKMFSTNVRATNDEVLLRVTPETLLTWALTNRHIYEFCKDDEVLRGTCILAAFRKYLKEKGLYPQVRYRTLNYMLLADEFVQVENEAEMKKKGQSDPAHDLAKKAEETKGGGGGTKGDIEGRDAMEDGTGNGKPKHGVNGGNASQLAKKAEETKGGGDGTKGGIEGRDSMEDGTGNEKPNNGIDGGNASQLAKKAEETKGVGDGTKGDIESRDALEDGTGNGEPIIESIEKKIQEIFIELERLKLYSLLQEF